MDLFKSKKKIAKELEDMKKKESEDPKVKLTEGEINTKDGSKEVKEEPKKEEVSLDQIILNNTDLWYKTQVLNLLISINNKLGDKHE